MTNTVKGGGKGKGGPGTPASDPIVELQRLLYHALQEAEKALEGRQELTIQSLHEIDLEIAAALRMLEALGHPWQHGERTEYEFMRLSIDKAIASRKKERRAELVGAWHDSMAMRDRLLVLRRELIALSGATEQG